jgi:cell envelope-related function transcriptional attenuator common domain
MNKLFRKNYSRRWLYIIWAVIAIRLIIPININFIHLSGMNKVSELVANHIQTTDTDNNTYVENESNTLSAKELPISKKTVDAKKSQNNSRMSDQNEILLGEQAVTPARLPLYLLNSITMIWIMGAILFLLYHLAAYYSFKTKVLRWSIAVKEPDILEQFQRICTDMGMKRQIAVVRSNQVTSPMLLGVIKPCIVLPAKNFTEEQYHFILKHELIHYKHHDLLYKRLLLWTTALHWFNPFVHYMVYLANNDIELYCDEELISKNNISYRENYSKLIIEIMTGVIKNNHILLSTNFGTSKKQLKNRFYQIMNAKPTKRGTGFIVALLCLILVGSSLAAFLIPKEILDAEAADKTLHTAGVVADNKSKNTADPVEESSNILIVGLDGINKHDNVRADSILLMKVNPETKTITLISFLRDMYLQIPDHGKNKLSKVYQLGGTGLMKKTIQTNFNLTIDNTVTVDMKAFEKMINAIGGVNIQLSQKEAKYLNSTNFISVKKYRNVITGKQKLNGYQALGYIRVRNVPTVQGESGDFGRTARLRSLLTSIYKDCSKMNKKNWSKLISNTLPYVTTDVTPKQLMGYLNLVLQDGMTIKSDSIPVKNSYTTKVQDNMSVLDIDLIKNRQALQ